MTKLNPYCDLETARDMLHGLRDVILRKRKRAWLLPTPMHWQEYLDECRNLRDLCREYADKIGARKYGWCAKPEVWCLYDNWRLRASNEARKALCGYANVSATYRLIATALCFCVGVGLLLLLFWCFVTPDESALPVHAAKITTQLSGER